MVEVGRFIGFAHVVVRPIAELPPIVAGGSAVVDVEVFNGENYAIPAFHEDDYRTTLAHAIYQERNLLNENPAVPLPRSIAPGARDTVQFEVVAPDVPGSYNVSMWIGTPAGLQWWKKFGHFNLTVVPQ